MPVVAKKGPARESNYFETTYIGTIALSSGNSTNASLGNPCKKRPLENLPTITVNLLGQYFSDSEFNETRDIRHGKR